MKLSAGEIDAIIAGCEGVTPGPWEWIDEGAYLCSAADSDGFVELIITTDLGHYGPHGPDAAHIARLDPATVLSLASEVKAFREAAQAVLKPLWVSENVRDATVKDTVGISMIIGPLRALDRALNPETETHSGTDE